ncbi:MAG: hypothetical protein U9Q30_04520 [Campylobacterota bacterium]|nr:hypothetical protein [Campylobacterota bacterium]
MSFKQAKELIERIELAELTLAQTLKQVDTSSKRFDDSISRQEKILYYMPKTEDKLNTMKIVVALNIGFIVGILVSKYIL